MSPGPIQWINDNTMISVPNENMYMFKMNYVSCCMWPAASFFPVTMSSVLLTLGEKDQLDMAGQVARSMWLSKFWSEMLGI